MTGWIISAALMGYIAGLMTVVVIGFWLKFKP